MSSASIVITTIDSEKIAKDLSEHIINKKLAACAQIISNVSSIYQWKGEIQHENELLIQFKTSSMQVDKLMEEIKLLHTYETPEIISIEIDKIDPEYQRWLLSVTG